MAHEHPKLQLLGQMWSRGDSHSHLPTPLASFHSRRSPLRRQSSVELCGTCQLQSFHWDKDTAASPGAAFCRTEQSQSFAVLRGLSVSGAVAALVGMWLGHDFSLDGAWPHRDRAWPGQDSLMGRDFSVVGVASP